MNVKRVRWILLMAAVLSGFCMLTACGGPEDADKDVPCDIGIVSEGNVYEATIDLQDRSWSELTEDEKENVVDQCLDTVELAKEGDPFRIIGTDGDTKEQIFTYDSEIQETIFCETL